MIFPIDVETDYFIEDLLVMESNEDACELMILTKEVNNSLKLKTIEFPCMFIIIIIIYFIIFYMTW